MPIVPFVIRAAASMLPAQANPGPCRRPARPQTAAFRHAVQHRTITRIGALAALVAASFAPPAPAAELADLEQAAFTAAVDAVADSVVQIHAVGGLDEIDDQQLAQGATTGVIVSADGHIVSSAFGFAQQPTSIIVLLADGTRLPADLIGRDDNRMLVLLKVDPSRPLRAAEPAPLGEIRPGDWAVAVGRTYGLQQPSMSVGVISALKRMHGRALQTDANVSAANYGGPLVDVHGRVQGVLVPMAPQAGGAGEANVTAGAEYYDSGIGFAVPLEDVLRNLPRWKEQKDLKRGRLGVSFRDGNPHATRPVITAVWPGSPAAAAGWKVDDRIVAVNGRQVETQTQLRFEVGPRYAGDKLKFTLRRGAGADAEEIETQITLADRLPPFRHAFLGVLPERTAEAAESQPSDDPPAHEQSNASTDEEDAAADPPQDAQPADEPASDTASDAASGASAGVAIGAVWPDSPADRAGVEAGDRLVKLGDKPVASADEAVLLLNAKSPGDQIQVAIVRDGQPQQFDVQLAELPTEILSASDLPRRPAADEAADEAALQELKLPEIPQTARYFAPPKDGRRHGLLVWLGPPGEETATSRAAAWRRICRRDGLILLMPEPADAAGWAADDLEYLGRLLQTALARFDVDPHRIVVAGEGRGGQLAYTLALAGRRTIRGVVAIDSPLPRTLEVPDNSSNERLAILSIEAEGDPLALLVRKDVARLTEAGYPVTVITRRANSDDAAPDSATRAQTARWIDGLDRF